MGNSFAQRKSIRIRFLHSMHVEKQRGQLVSKCLTTMKFMPAYRILIGYFSIISLCDIPQCNLGAGLHLKLETDCNEWSLNIEGVTLFRAFSCFENGRRQGGRESEVV